MVDDPRLLFQRDIAEGVLKNRLTLIGLDIAGEWNLPLLRNAADISGAELRFAAIAESPNDPGGLTHRVTPIDELLETFDHVVACEVTSQSRPIYEYPAPRGHLGVIVGNELSGIPRRILKRVEQVVSIPMLGRGMSSVNVAVAAAIMLYVLERDFGRKRVRTSTRLHRDVDVLVTAPADANELGSLFRSAWAFGWKQVFLADSNGVWFSSDRATVLAGRAAARREVNPLVVVSAEQIDFREYDRVIVCDGQRAGTPLSRFSLPEGGKILLAYGESNLPSDFAGTVEHVFVDHAVSGALPYFRHAGSIVLSLISQLLRSGRNG